MWSILEPTPFFIFLVFSSINCVQPLFIKFCIRMSLIGPSLCWCKLSSLNKSTFISPTLSSDHTPHQVLSDHTTSANHATALPQPGVMSWDREGRTECSLSRKTSWSRLNNYNSCDINLGLVWSWAVLRWSSDDLVWRLLIDCLLLAASMSSQHSPTSTWDNWKIGLIQNERN